MRLKWILAAVGALVLIALVVIIVILFRFDYNALKPRAEQAVYDATGRKLTMAGDIRLKLGLSPALAIESVSLENAEWGSRPELATVKRLEVKVALIPLLRRDVQIQRLILIGPDILIETDAEGNSNLKFEKPGETKPAEAEPAKPEEPAKEAGAPPGLTFDKLLIENGRLTYRDGKTGKTQTASILEFTASAPEREGPIEIEADGAYNENPFKLEGTVGSIAAALDPQQPWPLKLKAETLGTVINVDGSIKDVTGAKGIDLNVAAEGQSLIQLATLAGVKDLPETGPFSVTTNVTDPAAQTYRLSNLKLNMMQSDLTGTVDVALAGDRPKVNATLASQKLDLRPLLGKGAEGQPGAPAGKPAGEPAAGEPEKREKIFPQTPLPLDALRNIDARADVKAAQILLPQLALDNVSAVVELDDGSLKAGPIKASTGGGSFDGQAQLNAKSEAANLDLSFAIRQLNLGQMLADLGITERLEGILQADVQLAGRGKSVAELMGTSNGKFVTMIDGGRVNNKYLKLLESDIGTGLFNLLNPAAEGQTYTDLNCVVSRFDINNGVADTTVLTVDTNAMTVVGTGSINLGTEKLDLSLAPSAKTGYLAEASKKAGFNVGEVASAFRLGGTLAGPKLSIDPKQSVLGLGKTALGQALFGSPKKEVAEEDVCAAAKQIAETGKAPQPQKAPEKSIMEQLAPQLPEGGEGALGEAEKQLRGLFGK